MLRANALQMSSRQHANARPPGKRFWYMPPKVETREGCCIALYVYRCTTCEGACLRSKPKNSIARCHIKRLNAVRITNQPKLLIQSIPERERVHAAQLP